MSVAGVSLVLLLGLVNFALLLFQLSTGLGWIKVPFVVHRRTGILLAVCAALHGGLAFLSEVL